MHWLIALGVVAAALVTVPAKAADLYAPLIGGVRAGQFVIYDYEPGVEVRAYWRRPWGDRHYFPGNATPPELGRDEDLSQRDQPEPAEDYFRAWSSFPNERAERPIMYAPRPNKIIPK